MYRFLRTPRWIAFTALCAAMMALMAYLGWGWQLGRIHEKNDLKAAITAEFDKPPVPYSPELADWRSATLSGTYDDTATVRVPTNGGFFLYTPLRVADGSSLLARRGFINAVDPSATPAPAGPLDLTVRLRPVDTDDEGNLITAGLNNRWVLDVLQSSVTDASGVQALPAPKLPDTGNNVSYVVQWTIFAICVGVGWLLAVRRTAQSRRRAERGDEPTKRRRPVQAVPWRENESTD